MDFCPRPSRTFLLYRHSLCFQVEIIDGNSHGQRGNGVRAPLVISGWRSCFANPLRPRPRRARGCAGQDAGQKTTNGRRLRLGIAIPIQGTRLRQGYAEARPPYQIIEKQAVASRFRLRLLGYAGTGRPWDFRLPFLGFGLRLRDFGLQSALARVCLLTPRSFPSLSTGRRSSDDRIRGMILL